jgi:hypothetical protein
MSERSLLQRKMHEEVAKFEDSMKELRLLKNVSRHLRNYRRMMDVKEND